MEEETLSEKREFRIESANMWANKEIVEGIKADIYFKGEDVKEFIKIILKYIKSKNFDGSAYYLKSQILEYIKEKAGKDLI